MNNIKINYRNIFLGIIFLVFFEPKYLSEIATFDLLWKMARIIVFPTIILIYIFRGKYSKLIMWEAVLVLVYLFSSFINNGNLQRVANIYVKCIVFSMYLEIVFSLCKMRLFSILNFVYGSLIYINFILLCLFPNGLIVKTIDSIHFLGIDNTLVTYIMPAIVISIIDSYYKVNKVRVSSIVLIIISCLTIIRVWSATSLVAISIILIVFLLLRIIKKNNVICLKTYLVIYSFAFLQIMFINSINFIRVIIEEWLKKDMTFTGRDVIWQSSIELFKSNMVFGVGIRKSGFLVELMGFGQYANHSHNAILEILLSGGIVGLIIFIFMTFSGLKKIDRLEESIIKSILTAYTFGFFILTLTEVFISTYNFYLLLFLAYYSPVIFKFYRKKFIN